MSAAIELFDEQGYEATTVAEIAERAELTKRTFFRYFSDKREVLFSGSQELQRLWLEGLAAAPAQASPLAVVTAGLHPVAEMFTERHPFARIRAQVIEANPELQERELIKLQRLTAAITGALVERALRAELAEHLDCKSDQKAIALLEEVIDYDVMLVTVLNDRLRKYVAPK